MRFSGDEEIAATLELPAACRGAWEVAVVGAGPAGALAAGLLAQRGVRVVLIDRARFPRVKLCGCCVNRAAQAALAQAGLANLLADSGGKPLQRLRLAGGGIVAELPLDGELVLSRKAFDAALVRAAIARGAAFLPGTAARLLPAVEKDATQRTLALRQSDVTGQLAAQLVLACDGLAGRLLDDEPDAAWRISRSSRLGAGTIISDPANDFAPGVVHMAVGKDGYVGLVRLEDGRLDVAAALDGKACQRCQGPGQLVQQILQQARWPAPPELQTSHWSGTPWLTRYRRRLGAQRVLTLGDACGYVEPFTGEGIAWALSSALLAMDVVTAGLRLWREAIVAEWSACHRKAFARRRKTCWALTRLLRYQGLTAGACRLLQARPVVAAMILRQLQRPVALQLPA